MPAIYLCDVIGTGTRIDPFRPSIASVATDYLCLMIDDGPRKKSVAWSSNVSVTGTGISLVASGATKDDLIAAMNAITAPNNQRNQINSWLTSSGYTKLPANAVTVMDVVLFVCRQVNPAVDLSVIVA